MKSNNKIKFTCFDTETTGLGPQDRIVELALITFVYEDGKVKILNEYCSRYKVPVPMSYKAEQITGIKDSDLEKCPTFSEHLPQIIDVLKETDVLLAHNFSFDMKMLSREFGLAGAGSLEARTLFYNLKASDTLRIAKAIRKKIDSESLKLGVLCEYFKITLDNWHSALDDTKATVYLFQKLIAL